MSTLWTPDGERPVSRTPTSPPPAASGPAAEAVDEEYLTGDPEQDEAVRRRLAEIQEQLANAPAAAVVANHCYGFFELAALHLSQQPPNLEEARVAIDALGLVVEGLGDRLGEYLTQLSDGLAQLRIAFVQLRAATEAGTPPPS